MAGTVNYRPLVSSTAATLAKNASMLASSNGSGAEVFWARDAPARFEDSGSSSGGVGRGREKNHGCFNA